MRPCLNLLNWDATPAKTLTQNLRIGGNDRNMSSYEHQQIARILKQLDQRPQNDGDIAAWRQAKPHLQFLKQNARTDEIILYANVGHTTFIDAVITSETDVTPPNHDDLLEWNTSPSIVRAGYSYTTRSGGTREIKLDESLPKPTGLLKAQRIVFRRARYGVDDDDPIYYELLQEFIHASELHWRADQRAYCRIDQNGDLESVVSITRWTDSEPITLITCKREPLEIFLATSGKALVRFFDFMMVKHDEFKSWRSGSINRVVDSQDLSYDQCVHPEGHAYTRGVQIQRSPLTEQELFSLIFQSPSHRSGRQHACFIIKDWRNDKIVQVSTHPDDTTSYIAAPNNNLPFEVSPAFFRPEVLSKYKVDRDKYVIDESGRYITCRGTWSLKGYDVNEAGQVHAYISDLRSLPYQEQLHWQIHNEEPKGFISKRAIDNDIEGEWTLHITPLDRILSILRTWTNDDWIWWSIPNEDALLRINTPIANSRDEWAESFLELTKVTVDKFRPKGLRDLLNRRGIDYDKDDRSLALLEKLIVGGRQVPRSQGRLKGLREAQNIRSKVRAHGGGKEAIALSKTALLDHGTYRAHFEEVCGQIATELEEIQDCIVNV